MIQSITQITLLVKDQDEALAFYTEKLGFEKRSDSVLPYNNNFRWLTIGLPNQKDIELVLVLADKR